MTADWLPPDSVLSAWHRRFPNGPHPWAARLRLWRVELAVRPTNSSLLSEWIGRADAGRLGLPGAVAVAIRSGEPSERKWFAFLELPSGLRAIPTPADHFDDWPEPVATVPAEVLQPVGVEVLPFSGHWRTVPVVRAEMICVMAGRSGNGIDVYVVGEAGVLSDQPIAVLPADAIAAA